MSNKIEPIILVHGGAGNIPQSRVESKLVGVRKAVRLGYKTFKETGSITEATIDAIKFMEDDEAFNAGKGSVLTREGEIEMEALIMDGKKMKAGAVTCLRNMRNPIDVARLVMEKSPHVLLSGESAKKFAVANGIPTVHETYFYTDDARAALKKYLLNDDGNPKLTEIGAEESSKGDTVGAIGIDAEGNVISCTSTGGILGKVNGRIGDTPIPGAGGYADNSIGTVSTTGNGDAILLYNLAQRIMTAMDLGKNPKEAVEDSLQGLSKMTGKTAGAIVLSKIGEVGIGFNSAKMAWAYIKGNKVHFGIEQGEDFEEDL